MDSSLAKIPQELSVTVCLFLFLSLWDSAAFAQSAAPKNGASQPLRFDVATIKPSPEQHMVGVDVFPGGRVQTGGLSLKGLIATAFNLGYWQISGGDEWTGKVEYDLEAKPAEQLRDQFTNIRHSLFAIDDPQLREMLQSLLIERFQLKFHRETRTGDIYLLERSGKSIKLLPSRDLSTGKDARVSPGWSGDIDFVNGQFSLYNTSMPQLAMFASNDVVHKQVIDRTGLTGSYDFTSTIHAEQSDFENTFMLLIPELGLKLERAKGPVETFVIDHAEMPSPN